MSTGLEGIERFRFCGTRSSSRGSACGEVGRLGWGGGAVCQPEMYVEVPKGTNHSRDPPTTPRFPPPVFSVDAPQLVITDKTNACSFSCSSNGMRFSYVQLSCRSYIHMYNGRLFNAFMLVPAVLWRHILLFGLVGYTQRCTTHDGHAACLPQASPNWYPHSATMARWAMSLCSNGGRCR